jgi:hypothetical protein
MRKLAIILFIILILGNALPENIHAKSEKDLEREIISDLKIIYKHGKDDDLSKLRACGVAMRENQEFADKIYIKSRQLCNDFFMVGVAANPVIKLCVSCLSSAINNCIDLDERFKETLPEIE